MKTSFLVIESLAWSHDQAEKNSKDFYAKLDAGWNYRHAQQAEGKIQWNQSIEPNARGIIFVEGTLSDLQAYFAGDPWGEDNMVKREVIPLAEPSMESGSLNTEAVSLDELEAKAGVQSLMGFDFAIIEPDVGAVMANCSTNNGGGY